MTELTYLVRKRTDLTDTQFHTACDRYEAFLKTSAEALGIRNAEVRQRVSSLCERCFAMPRSLSEPAFDAQITMAWDSIDAYTEGAGSAQGIAVMDALVAEEKKFIDLGKSQAFFVDHGSATDHASASAIGSEILSS
ncbi:MAG: hypothetical protein AAGA91_19450 [Pseudomonadota bacterium]